MLSVIAPFILVTADTVNNREISSYQAHDVEPMLLYCWATVCDAGPTLSQHWLNVPCLLRQQLLCKSTYSALSHNSYLPFIQFFYLFFFYEFDDILSSAAIIIAQWNCHLRNYSVKNIRALCGNQ